MMFNTTSHLIPIAALVLGCVLDFWRGEPRHYHPVVIFGQLATLIEERIHMDKKAFFRGALAWCLTILPLVGVASYVQYLLQNHWLYVPVAGIVLYSCIGWKSLAQHGLRVAEPLQAEELPIARQALSMIVSRDVSALDETGIANAATESILENGADAIFAALFWFGVLGLPGVVLYRASNTLDAMWGYKNERYIQFGKWSARMDDLLNWIPARITVLTYMIASGSIPRGHAALHCAWTQGRRWKSPNAGPVMAAGAAALGLRLGGIGVYHGVRQDRGPLGEGREAQAHDIRRAIALVNRAGFFWLVGLIVASVL